MVAGVWVGGSCVFRVDLGLRVGNLGDSGRSLNGSLGVLFCPRCVGTWNLGNLGGGRWFLGSNFHFVSVLLRLCLCVGWDLGIIVLSGGWLCLAGSRALYISVVSCSRH